MKVTVAILNKNIKSLENFISNMIIIFCAIFMMIALCFFMQYIYISPEVLKFATNFRQADKIELSLKDLVSTYPIFNASNYVIKDGKDNESIKANSENTDEISAIDSMVSSEKLETIDVFGKSQNLNLSITNSSDVQKISVYDIKIINYSSKRSIDYDKLFSKVITLTKKSDNILLYDTHTSESYEKSDRFPIEYTGTYRSTNAKFNMITVAAEFEKNLTQKGFKVKQDTTPHDYGTYTSAYSKSRTTVKNELNELGHVGLSIDVHRDATGDLSYAPSVMINGVKVAQCMFVIGVGTDTQQNPYWEDNLALALQLQKIANNVYPGLFRQMIIRDSLYNQDLNKFSLLIEVGATGNTIDEALLATRCLTNLLNILYKN